MGQDHLQVNDYEVSHDFNPSNDGNIPPKIHSYDIGRRSMNVGSHRTKMWNIKRQNARTPLRESYKNSAKDKIP